MQDDSTLLSVFLFICHGNPDNNLESLCITILSVRMPDSVLTFITT
jgi:hypothetical protein